MKALLKTLWLSAGADYQTATSVYKADGKTYVDLVGANSQSIEKIITLNGDYEITQITDKGSSGIELRFGEVDNENTASLKATTTLLALSAQHNLGLVVMMS